jgi:ubiquinone/menaquinone biosynthesis C-methylase UbiE
MKRYHRGESKSVENEEIDAFLQEIARICKEHGFSLSHEDTHGSFIVEKYDKDNIQWLMQAMIGESIDID